MSVINKKVFKVTLDSKEVELCVVRPNVKQRQEGQRFITKPLGMLSSLERFFVVRSIMLCESRIFGMITKKLNIVNY